MSRLKAISFQNEKGGVGKSTLSTIIAAMLAAMGYRVVFIDADPQGNSTDFWGLSKRPDFYRFCVQSLPELGKQPVMRSVARDRFALDPECKGSLMVIGGDTQTRHLATLMDTFDENNIPALDSMVIRTRTLMLASVADYVIFDTAPTPSPLHFAVAAASTHILMPTECEPFSGIQGLPDTVDHAANAERLASDAGVDAAKLLAIIPNMYKKSSPVHESILKTLRAAYGALVWEEVNETETIRQSHLQHRALNVLYPKTKITKQLWSFAKRIEALA